ncbi:CaiB/BaiF CoA transferase family protein [Cohaesibacter gelatinilyticus]|uniref:Crotonobetainyl-CoA:carnitine CoA-transferase CaiB n=1 Tax=Cohaesibacter gelatinilyticus TaxID=372072 RepID=A0A285NE44_9HYPH|nr:CaiB/BaiF CoA-transferase family protein [Cohaesibacter gelatinilyticus]SNZ07227.1 Crotonobetainyl-CoA:carnitine CoA-transferase CaiB [Cohaesibacter gelatinilyticus]
MVSIPSRHDQPLTGLLVVSLEQAVAAPTCSVKLADAGARVIKIEREEGDPARKYDEAVKGTSAYFAWLNRGKESAVLDIKTEPDMELLHKMLERADVFIQNFAPGATKRLGLGGEELTARYPKLIVVDIYGYGQDSAYRDMRAYDMLVQAESGICTVTGTPDEAVKVGVSIADIGTGMVAHALVLEALIGRGITGKGKHIKVAMFDCMADWMSVPLLYQDYLDHETTRNGLSHAVIYPYTKIACKDGDLVIAIQNHSEWLRLCEGVLERPDLPTNPLFETNPRRSENRLTLDEEINPIFAGWTRKEAIERLIKHKIAWSRVTKLEELPGHPALKRGESILPNDKAFSLPLPPGRERLDYKKIPALGAHTEAVRLEFS